MTATLTSPSVNLDPAIANLETVADLLERLGGIPACRVRWKPYPGTATEKDLIALVDGPNLAVEVLSKGNTRREMKIKREEYFQGGARLVWEINPKKQSARVYTSPTQCQEIGPDGVLDGGDVLPGFVLPLKRLFTRAQRGT